MQTTKFRSLHCALNNTFYVDKVNFNSYPWYAEIDFLWDFFLFIMISIFSSLFFSSFNTVFLFFSFK